MNTLSPTENVIAALVGLYLLFRLFAFLSQATRLIKLCLHAPLQHLVPREALALTTPIYDAAAEELARAGFRYRNTISIRSTAADADQPEMFYDIYHHAEHDFYARIGLCEIPIATRLYTVTLANFHVDGTVLLTTSDFAGELLPGYYKVVESTGPDLAGMIGDHLRARMDITVARCTPDDALAMGIAQSASFFEDMIALGKTYRRGEQDGEAIYGIRAPFALRITLRLPRRAAALRKRLQALAPQSGASGEAMDIACRTAQQQSMIRNLAVQKCYEAPRWLPWASLLLSAPAFLALGAWLWNFRTALCIGLVIAFHEGGHWLAMKLAGFRNVQVFFVPGLGGATTGTKHDAGPLTQVLMYLAGPFPGLLLAAAFVTLVAAEPELMRASWYPFCTTLAAASLFINLLNLLPFTPLDGGRALDLLLFSRLPWLRLVFNVGSGVLLLCFGLHRNTISFAVIGIAMLAGIQSQIRLAQATQALMGEGSDGHKLKAMKQRQVLAYLVDLLFQPRFERWHYQARHWVAANLLPRIGGGFPSWSVSAAGMALYLGAIALPIAAVTVATQNTPVEAVTLFDHIVHRVTGISLHPENRTGSR